MVAAVRNFPCRMHTPCKDDQLTQITIWCRNQSRDAWGYFGISRPVSLNIHVHVRLQCDFNVLHGTCVGQASNPGPWTIRTHNVVSANKHLDSLSLSTDCTVWTETTATRATQERAARTVKPMHSYVNCSMPAPSHGPKAKMGKPEAMGVMIFSSTPSKDLSGEWDPAIYNTARVADVLLRINGGSVRVIAVYGYHSGIPEHIPKNDRLMAHVFSVATKTKMPTIITGDINCDICKLQAWQSAQSVGYVDVAVRQAEFQRRQPDNTFRGISRLDYILCDPLAAMAFRHLHVDPRGFTDHAELTVTFQWDQVVQTIPNWLANCDAYGMAYLRTPARETAPTVDDVEAFYAKLQHGSIDECFHAFNNTFERKLRDVHHKVCNKPLPAKYIGRGKGRITAHVPHAAYYSRHGKCLAGRTAIGQRMRVLDWIAEMVFHMEKGNARAHIHRLWQKIWRAAGFPGGFAAWVMDSEFAAFVPLDIPSLQWLQEILVCMRCEAKHWEHVRRLQQRHSVSETFLNDWKSGGRLHAAITKGPNLGTLDSLVHTKELPVRLCRSTLHAKAKFAVQNPREVIVGATWVFQDLCTTVSEVSGNTVTVCSTAQCPLQQRVVEQRAWTTDTEYIVSEVARYWDKYWNATPDIDWDALAVLLDRLPTLPSFDPMVTAKELIDTVATIPVGKARGLDNWSNGELRMLSDTEFQMLADLLNRIVVDSVWPEQMLDAAVSLLAKVQCPQTPKHSRPITVLATLYRLWAKVQSKKMFASMIHCFLNICMVVFHSVAR